jgi:predicted AAA+ superfamily ATPase
LGKKELLILDEIHKMPNWKNYIKGFYDVHKDTCNVLLTGSSKLNIFRKGGDSLMGRYFNYTVHPITVGEILYRYHFGNNIINSPKKIEDDIYSALYTFGGFPEPFIKQSTSFHNMWQNSRLEQLFREDIRNAENIRAVDQMELLALLLRLQVGSGVKYSNLASKVKVTNTTILHWIKLLGNFYYCFSIKPWSANVSRSLIKEPKTYLWDWSSIENEGARFENFLAVHLFKSVSLWNETGVGKFDLHYIKDKDGREVDFAISRDNKIWILIEAKLSNEHSISKNLYHFASTTSAEHAFQVVHNMDYCDISCFNSRQPIIVPAKTLLSQLA